MENELCDIVIVDCETSGLYARQGHELIELAAMRFDPRTMLPRVGCVDLLVKPKHSVAADAFCRRAGYSEAEWEEKAVSLEDALEALAPMLVGRKMDGAESGVRP